MAVTSEALLAKVREIYPELKQRGVGLSAVLDDDGKSWIVTMIMGENSLSTHIEVQDAERCLQGHECMTLGVQVGRFIENYCLGGKACPM